VTRKVMPLSILQAGARPNLGSWCLGEPPTDTAPHTNGISGEAISDVTLDVLDGGSSWTLYRDGGSGNVHYAKDHAGEVAKP
jgi:hypothetical protein